MSRGRLSQNERVLRALRQAAGEGLRSTAFLLPDVVDGGAPILRLASRVADLRADGHSIRTERDGSDVRYFLIAAVPPLPRAEVSDPKGEPATLEHGAGVRPRGRVSPFDPWADA